MCIAPEALIIDTDPGIDDAAAILFALGLEALGKVKLLAITVVNGNVSLDKTYRNALIISEWAQRPDVPVFPGAHTPLLAPVLSAEDVHGQTGLGSQQLPQPKERPQPKKAHRFLIETLQAAPTKTLALCAIGPLTNIALALSAEPDCIQGIKQLLIMGGNYLSPGNITPNAEFNFYIDPDAAEIVLRAPIKKYIFPLELTEQAQITHKRMDALRTLNNENGRRIADLLQDYSRYDIQQFGLEGGPLHDPCPVAYLVAPHLFKSKSCHARLERTGLMQGAVHLTWHQNSNQPNVEWCYHLDSDGFFDLFTRAFSALP